MDKKIPNPDGKKGGQKHQDKVKEVAADIIKREMDIGGEHYIKASPGGASKNRFVDVAGIDLNTGQATELHQIGKQNKNGTPVKRERDAIEDIEKERPIKVVFHPYNLVILFFMGIYLFYSYLS